MKKLATKKNTEKETLTHCGVVNSRIYRSTFLSHGVYICACLLYFTTSLNVNKTVARVNSELTAMLISCTLYILVLQIPVKKKVSGNDTNCFSSYSWYAQH